MTSKSVEKAAQSDPAPVLKRTTGLPEEADYLWYSGTLESRAPGPSSYWVDALVTMDESEIAPLRRLCEDDAASRPEVVDDLARELDVEDFRECPEAARRIAADGWQTRAWISASTPALVLTLLGEG